MKGWPKYGIEFVLLMVVIATSVAGFWNLYFGPEAAPSLYHHMHVGVNFLWIALLLYQLSLVSRNKFKDHRRSGLMVLVFGPLLVASTALLSVHSAHKGLVSGEGDALIVQNVGVTLELAAIILLGFIFRKRRKLHASFLMSTSILFFGIAFFFTLISFVPAYKIEGPDTFYRFATAGIAGQNTCLVLGFLLCTRDFKNGWPYLLAGSMFWINDLVTRWLTSAKLIQPLTETVGGMNQPVTFAATLLILFGLLLATGVGRRASTQTTSEPDRL